MDDAYKHKISGAREASMSSLDTELTRPSSRMYLSVCKNRKLGVAKQRPERLGEKDV